MRNTKNRGCKKSWSFNNRPVKIWIDPKQIAIVFILLFLVSTTVYQKHIKNLEKYISRKGTNFEFFKMAAKLARIKNKILVMMMDIAI